MLEWGFIFPKIKFPTHMTGIVFDTQAMCASTLIAHNPSLTVDGYRFRYPSYYPSYYPPQSRVSFSIPTYIVAIPFLFAVELLGIVFDTYA